MIYSPSEDSFLLAESLKPHCNGKKVLDMGSGSGYLAEKSLQAGASSVLAVDIDSESVTYIKSKGIPVVKSDLFHKVSGKYDVILFNPPYLPEDENEDEESKRITTGGKKGDEIILKFLETAPAHLNPKGSILLLLSSLTPKKEILQTLKKIRFSYKKISSKSLFMEKLEVWDITRNV